MHKRILCVLLAAVVVFSLIPVFALTTQAASNMKTSERCIDILKAMEGFIKYPMYDNGQYSVGYGSGCNPEDYPDGITEEEADALLRAYLVDMEKALNNFANQQAFLFSQNQFDALMLFTYNCGSGWTRGNGEFRQAVLENATGNAFIFEITQWSAASGQLHLGLVTRRLIEADMYLNGSYANVKPASYTYVIYDNNQGTGKARVQGYDYELPAYVQSLPVRDGYQFLGWYTALEKGNWVTALKAEHAKRTLYAHWQPNGTTPETAVAASYQVPSSTLVSRDFYDVPGGKVEGTLNADAAAVIRADYVDAKGVKWGRLPNGCWVKLGDPRNGTGVEIDKEPETGVKVTVTGDYVNVRTGPGTQYNVVSAVLQGDVITITQVSDVNGTLWGKFRGGWVCLEYTDYSGGLVPGDPGTNVPEAPAEPSNPTVPTDPSPTEPEATEPETTEPETTVPPEEEEKPSQSEPEKGSAATVISKTGLNIRSGSGTSYPIVGSYASGQKIRIQEMTTVAGVVWGRTDKGWVCMQYVRLEEKVNENAGVSGRVISTTGLNIRSGPGVAHPPVGSYKPGSTIVILEQTVVSGRKWGRTDMGWVCMEYVRLEGETTAPGDNQGTQKPSEPEPNDPNPQVPAPAVVTGTVTASMLNVRNSAGTDGTIVACYRKGDKIQILEQTMVNGVAWGRTDKGWVSLAYVKLDVSNGNSGQERIGVITASSLCIRKGPGTGNAIQGFYRKGEKVTILETTKVGATLWGRTNKGWICMDYVK